MKKISTGKIVLLSILAFIVILGIGCVGSYNNLVGLSETVKTQQSNIETQLQRRADLIPNLVNTVKGSSLHESSIIDEISNARASLSGASSLKEKANADSELTSALNRLMVVVENYPDLKANAQYSSLMDELAGTENRITVARKDYNDAVKEYNTKIKRFPTNIVSGMFGYGEKEYFQASEGSEEVPTVDFNTVQ